jgi:prophage DNA circulation protein
MSGSALIPSGIGSIVQGIGTAATIDNTGLSWEGSTWWQQLQPGSWRGVGFVMDAAETKAGRRVAVHEYPYRDTIWAEDLGKLPRRFSFQAFIVGDDCYQQRDAMISACETAGPGTLVHPTLGSLSVVLLDFSTTDRRERGRMVEISFAFIMAGDVQFPTAAAATGQNVVNAAAKLTGASTADLSSTLSSIGTLPASGLAGVSGFASLATLAVDDPTRALNAVNGLTGYYGRYATGALMSLLPPSATVATQLAANIAARTTVYSAAQGLSAALAAL